MKCLFHIGEKSYTHQNNSKQNFTIYPHQKCCKDASDFLFENLIKNYTVFGRRVDDNSLKSAYFYFDFSACSFKRLYDILDCVVNSM